MTNKKSIDCNDPKNKDKLSCTLSQMLISIIIFSLFLVFFTIIIWVIGGIIIAKKAKLSHLHRGAIIIGGIFLCILITPVIPTLIFLQVLKNS